MDSFVMVRPTGSPLVPSIGTWCAAEQEHAIREWRRQYPAELKFHIRRINHRADLVVVEYLISYDAQPWRYVVNVMEFRGDRVARERIYIMDPWEAPEWREPWRAETPADPPPPPP